MSNFDNALSTYEHTHFNKVLKSSNENSKKPLQNTAEENDTDDLLVVRKLEVKQRESKETHENKNYMSIDELIEENLLAEEYEAIVKRQLQMLQADERGKIALNNEIAEIKKLHKKRAEALNARKRALEIEKERAKKIASLPPPLSRSVKELLKENDKKGPDVNHDFKEQNCDAHFEGLQGNAFLSRKEEKLAIDLENKENMSEEFERKRIQVERDMRAKKRFNEALKKDRMKQEYLETIKQIENADQANRRLQAKNVSSKGGTIPCSFPDKLLNSERQVAMEDAVENIYKNNNTKEHAIEDLEGYEDQWENKYKKVDSNLANKMTDCVPKFVKENYSYLLEDESVHQCGKRFSGLDISSDELNMAYIESPPNITSSEEIDAVISQLDKMRAETNKVYEKEFKPLLQKDKEEFKPQVQDKAVDTHILKQPTVDKAVDNFITSPEEKNLSSKGVQVNVLQGGVMGFQRRDLGSRFKSYNKGIIDTHLERKSPQLENWSCSSYFSLPSNHGMSNMCNLCDSPNCHIPVVETHLEPNNYILLSKAPAAESRKHKQESIFSSELKPIQFDRKFTKISSDYESKVEAETSGVEDNCISSNDTSPLLSRSNLSYFIQQVADKYLKNKVSKSETITPIKILSSHKMNNSDSSQVLIDINKDEFISVKKADLTSFQTGTEVSDKQNSKLTSPIISSQTSAEAIVKSVEICSPFRIITTSTVKEEQETSPKHIYHELSTIPEMDSALTNDSVPMFANISKKSSFGEIVEENNLLDAGAKKELQENTCVSLIDVPPSEISDFAKNIKFFDADLKVDTKSPTPITSGAQIDLKTNIIVDNSKATRLSPTSITSQTSPGLENAVLSPEPQTPKLSPSLCISVSTKSLSSHEPGTPQLDISDQSDYSTPISQRTPYSSTFKDSNREPPFLTDATSLPRYFEDMSSVRQGDKIIKYQGGFQMSPLQPSDSDSISSYSQLQNKGQSFKFQSKMNNQVGLIDSSTSSFKVPTQQPYLSSRVESQFFSQSNMSDKMPKMEEKQMKPLQFETVSDNSLGSFKPLTPVSYHSNSDQSNFIDVMDPLIAAYQSQLCSTLSNFPRKPESNVIVKSFTSDISSPTVTHSYSPMKPREIQRLIAEEVPSIQNIKGSKDFHKGPQLNTDNNNVVLVTHIPMIDNQSVCPSSDESFKPLTPHANLSPPITSHMEDFPNTSYDISYQTPTSVLAKYPPITLRFNIKSPGDQSHLKCNSTTAPLNTITWKQSSKMEAKTCKSDYFIPQLNADDYHVEKKAEAKSTEPIVEITSQFNRACSDLSKLQSKNKTDVLVSTLDVKSSFPVKLDQNGQRKEALPAITSGSQISTPSSENISSQFSGSKINFQSTPIKTIEEIIQETGIMEEPELTLFTSELTIMPESPKKIKLATNVHSKEDTIASITPTLESTTSTQSTCTPNSTPSVAPMSDYCDSPSMMSFIKHEMSCFSNLMSEASPVPGTSSSTGSHENSGKKEKTHSAKKTPGQEYKTRTKRLWNNLEEVKARKLLEERKKQMLKNRLKMKAYSKKFVTPKKKD